MSFIGMVVLIGIAILFSKDRRAINLRTVAGAFAIQLLFGAFVLYTSIGKTALQRLSDGVGSVIQYGNDGIDFLFGDVTRTSFEDVHPREISGVKIDSVDFVQKIISFENVDSIKVLDSDSLLYTRPNYGSLDFLSESVNLRVHLDSEYLNEYSRSDVVWVENHLLTCLNDSADNAPTLTYLKNGDDLVDRKSLIDLTGNVNSAYIDLPSKPYRSVGFVFAFKVLPVIIFFSALISVLYYLGIMQWVINLLGGALRFILGTSRAESLSATANIFVGQTEAPLVVKPFIKTMTRSELFAVMCGGLASVAGSVLAGYASMGVPLEYLIAASFMAAPGGLLFAKIIIPETEKPSDKLDGIEGYDDEEEPVNVVDAAASGASSGLKLALNVGAMLLAFVGLIALINGIFSVVGAQFGYEDITLELILGYVFSPLAFLIGVPWEDATIVGSFIGQKLVINEFIAYENFQDYLTGDLVGKLTEKSRVIVSFALCGFANLSSIAILIGGLGGIAPSRRAEIARFGLLAVLAGTLSNLMSATIAGLFMSI